MKQTASSFISVILKFLLPDPSEEKQHGGGIALAYSFGIADGGVGGVLDSAIAAYVADGGV